MPYVCEHQRLYIFSTRLSALYNIKLITNIKNACDLPALPCLALFSTPACNCNVV